MQNQHFDFYLKQFDIVRWVPRQVAPDEHHKVIIFLDQQPAILEKRLLDNFVKSLDLDESEIKICIRHCAPNSKATVIYCFGLKETDCQNLSPCHILPSLSEIIQKPALKRLLWEAGA